MDYLYPFGIDFCVTLRCNAKCPNCVEMCNTKNVTGLDYSDSDMTLGQIEYFINEVKLLGRKNIGEGLGLTGGEPLLHPNIEEIVKKFEELVSQGYFKFMVVSSNLTVPIPPYIKKYIVNSYMPKDNYKVHQCSLIHPKDFGGIKQTYNNCHHHRKPRVVVTYQGVSLCCAADAYIRLFNMEDLILDHLPKSMDEFKSIDMDKVCEHCPFGSENVLPFERDKGAPQKNYQISNIYAQEAQKNILGRKISKRYPSI